MRRTRSGSVPVGTGPGSSSGTSESASCSDTAGLGRRMPPNWIGGRLTGTRSVYAPGVIGVVLDQFSCQPGGVGTCCSDTVLISGSGRMCPDSMRPSDSDVRPIGSVMRTLTSTASACAARRMIARYSAGLVPSSRHAPESLAGCTSGSSDSGPSNATSGASPGGAPTRRALIVIVWCPSGVFDTGALLVHLSSTSAGAVPGQSIVIAERSGGVGGGMTTHADVLAGERAGSVPRSRSASDQGAARYHTRFHEPDGVSTPLAVTMCVPSSSVVDATFQPGVDASSVSTGGPIVSSSLAASSTRTRCRSIRRTRGPLRGALRSCQRHTGGVTLRSRVRVPSTIGTPGFGTRGTANAYSAVDDAGHGASTCPALTPSTTYRWIAVVPRGRVTSAEVALINLLFRRVKSERRSAGCASNTCRSLVSRWLSVCSGDGSGSPTAVSSLVSVVS